VSWPWNGAGASRRPLEVISEDYLRRTYRVETEIHDIRRRDGQLARLCVPTAGVP